MYLSDYTSQAQTEAFNKAGAFFAFTYKQFEEGRKEGIKYAHLGSGLLAPVDKVKELTLDLQDITIKGVAKDIEENGIKKIIHRELANHECQITGDYSPVVDNLSIYDITESQVKAEWKEFFQYCIDNDYF